MPEGNPPEICIELGTAKDLYSKPSLQHMVGEANPLLRRPLQFTPLCNLCLREAGVDKGAARDSGVALPAPQGFRHPWNH